MPELPTIQALSWRLEEGMTGDHDGFIARKHFTIACHQRLVMAF